MGDSRNFTEKSSADNKEVGFQYQYYYFLYSLLNLKSGQSVGIEVRDDVHTELNNDSQILFQLKHTVQKNSVGEPIALTELDVDLWKTISNWINIITDPDDGRENKKEQISFINKTEFHLVTNKSESVRNKFVSNLESFKLSKVKTNDIRLFITNLYKKTKDEVIKDYIKTLLDIDDEMMSTFLKKIHFRLGENDLINLIKQSIREKMVAEKNIDSVFSRLDSNVRHDNFICISERKKVEIGFDSFYKRYRKIFSDSREPLQKLKEFGLTLPNDLFTQNFIKQLLHVNAVKDNDTEKVIELTTSKLKIARYLDEWVQDGELVSDEIDFFHNDVIKKWINYYDHFCEGCDDSDLIRNAKSLLYELRRIDFSISSNNLGTELSNGELYYLSDEHRIGWHRDWKELT